MLKRVAILLFCLMMVFIATFGFVVGVVTVPTIYSYAAVDDDPIYVPLRDPSDSVLAFQSYCKSRDLTIEGSLSDAVTTFTTGVFNSACNELGINITELQAEIMAEYDSSGKPVKFLFNDTGIMAMNRIFAQFLQDNELSVGDTDVNQIAYSGDYFEDQNGIGAFIYYVVGRYASGSASTPDESINNYILKYGSAYAYEKWQYEGNTSINVPLNSVTYNLNLVHNYDGNIFKGSSCYSDASNSCYSASSVGSAYTFNYADGNIAIIKNQNNDYYLGWISYSSATINSNNSTWIYFRWGSLTKFNPNTNGDLSSNVNIYIVSNEINNNTYEGDTIINNDGDVIVEPEPIPPGGNDPGWDIGGGGGTATDGNGNTWNIQFPDFQLPDLNIDWSINGLGEKFPFSVPFDLVALVTVLNAEPQAPRFAGTVNFGFTTWNYDINLQQFDSVAQACRIAELLLLVFGLILVTRSIIKG